jgi:hypothetical protein
MLHRDNVHVGHLGEEVFLIKICRSIRAVRHGGTLGSEMTEHVAERPLYFGSRTPENQ